MNSLSFQDEINPEYKVGEISCPINHIHPDWDILIQKYVILEQLESDLGYVYLSTFEVFLKNDPVPANLSSYERDHKVALWILIFEIKSYYLDRYKPAIVLHEIKNEFPFTSRFAWYNQSLTSKFYRVLYQKPNIILVIRKDIVEKQDVAELY